MPGRTRCDQHVPSDSNIAVVITNLARSARSRTSGFPAASSPKTMSAPISSSGRFRGRPRRPRPASVRRARDEVDGRLVAEALRQGERVRSARGIVLRPDDRDAPCSSRLRFASRSSPAAFGLAQGGRPGGASGRRRRGARRVQGDDLGARAAGGAEPEVEDRRAFDDRLVAEDEADIRVANRRDRRAEAIEGGMESVREQCDPPPSPSFASRAIGSRSPRFRLPRRRRPPGRRPPEAALGLVQSLLPARPARTPRRTRRRGRDPVVGAQVSVGEAALVAQPAFVHLGVVSGEDPRHLALARRRPGVTPDRAEAADRRDVLDLPGAGAEPVGRRGERADRAELEDVAGEVRAIGIVFEGGDHRSRAAAIATSCPSSETVSEKRVQR